VKLELLRREVIVDYRPDAGIRISPHFYNTDEECDRAIDEIRDILATEAWKRHEGTKHTFATDAIRRGVPERHLQRFLGHASIQSTGRYARLADNALVEVLRMPARHS